MCYLIKQWLYTKEFFDIFSLEIVSVFCCSSDSLDYPDFMTSVKEEVVDLRRFRDAYV